MKARTDLQRYLEFVDYETRSVRTSAGHRGEVHQPVVTISRQAGSGAHIVADELVALLQARAAPGSSPWTIFDRNLVDQVLKDHDLPERLAEFMPEDRVSGIADTIDELFGLHPGTWGLVRKTASTILHLAELGNVVVIGRAANIITGELGYAFHVRLVGSVERRIRHVEECRGLSHQAAADYVRQKDVGRKRYVKKYYGRDIDDPLLYDVVVNTDRFAYAEAARMIAYAVAPAGDSVGRAQEPDRART
jgi:cytidylate kinase